jgi:hypothetical protein
MKTNPQFTFISTMKSTIKSSLNSDRIASKALRMATGSLLAVLPALTGIRADSAELVCGNGTYAYQGACVIVPARGVVVAPAPVVVPAPGYGTRGYGAPGVPAAGAPGYGAAGQGANVNGGVNRAGRR